MQRKYHFNPSILFLFLSFLLLSGFVSARLGRDLGWDLANYHYYNAYAFFNNRQSIDYWPLSFVHRFYSPTGDFLNYFIINHLSPYYATFLLGAIHGLAAWFVFLIAWQFTYKEFSPLYATGFAVILAAMGMYSALVFISIGDLKNDNLAAIFVLAYVYMFLKYLHESGAGERREWIYLVLSNVFLGIGLGVKLTNAVYIVGGVMALMLISLPIKTRVKAVVLSGVGIAGGLLLANGYWMLHLWQMYQNPVFPFFNAIFQSPYVEKTNLNWNMLLPNGFLEAIIYPISFSLKGNSYADGSFTDLRYAILYVLFIIFAIKSVLQIVKGDKQSGLSIEKKWLFLFIAISFIAWEVQFSIVRYLTVTSMLAPIAIYLLVKELAPNKQYNMLLIFVLYYAMIVTVQFPQPVTRYRNYQGSYFNPQLPTAITGVDQALVLIAFPKLALTIKPKPLSYLVPFFPKKWKFVGVPFDHQQSVSINKAEFDAIQSIIDSSSLPYYVMTSDSSMLALINFAKELGLKQKKDCYKIEDNRQLLSSTDTIICQVSKA